MAVLYLHHPRFLFFFCSNPPAAAFQLLDEISCLFPKDDIFSELVGGPHARRNHDIRNSSTPDPANNAGRCKIVSRTNDTRLPATGHGYDYWWSSFRPGKKPENMVKWLLTVEFPAVTKLGFEARSLVPSGFFFLPTFKHYKITAIAQHQTSQVKRGLLSCESE